MLLYRVLCAALVAWAINWALSRPEAASLNEALPEFVAIAPLAGALVGFVNLAKRQGWGGVVAIANGIWAGFLTLVLTGVIYVFISISDSVPIGDVKFDFMGKLTAEAVAEVMDEFANFPLVIVCLASTAVVGLVTEVIHWALVKIRKRRGIKERNDTRMQRPSLY